MKNYILAHDLGTSGNKASLFSTDGALVDSITVPYKTYYPKRGWSEQNALDWWNAVCQATKAIIKNQESDRVCAIAVSGQMMGCLPLDTEGVPLCNSIIWSDARAEEESEQLIKALGEEHYNSITGQPASANYPLPKIMWLRKHHPEIMEKAECFLQAKDYINYCFTGNKYTDPTDAAYTLAYDIKNREWSKEILNVAGIPVSLFPKVVDCETIVGKVTKEAAEECGIVAGIPVVASAGDGSAAHLGAACVEHGKTYVCLGSSTWIVSTTNKLVFDQMGRMQSEPHVLKDTYAYVGTMQTGGLAHSWAKKELFNSQITYNDIDEMVIKSSPGADGVIFMPYLMGERSPWYDTKVNGAFLGIRQQTNMRDVLRAVMEGVGFNLNILLNIIRKDVEVKEIVLIGGGAKSKIWKQILADIFDVPILVPQNVESGTSIGAAIIAGVGCGIFKDYSVARDFLEIGEIILPRKEYTELYHKEAEIFEEAYYALKGINEKISRLNL